MTTTAHDITTGWLTKAGKYRVEKMPMPHPVGRVDLMRPPAGVTHTIEGSLESGIGVFRKHYAPTFGVGPGRIVQFVPFGYMTAALENDYGGGETNRWARVQIEIAGFSKDTTWLPAASTLDPLAALMAALVKAQGIPLTRPYPDALPSKPWATELFRRRHDGKWGKTAGWFGHIEIPENAHWDPGALDWSALLKLATAKLPKATPAKPKAAWYTIRAMDDRGRDYAWRTRTPGDKLASFDVQKHRLVHVEIDRE